MRVILEKNHRVVCLSTESMPGEILRSSKEK